MDCPCYDRVHDVTATGLSTLVGCDTPITEVLQPMSFDWRVPASFECNEVSNSMIAPNTYLDQHMKDLHDCFQIDHKSLAAVPSYHSAYYKYSPDFMHGRMHGFHDLVKGMACSLGSIFQFEPSAATKHQPDLFTPLLPALQLPDNLVIALYIRTGRAEV